MPKMNVTDPKAKEDMRLKRILESPLHRSYHVHARDLIVDDKLEEGILRIYEPGSNLKDAILVGEMRIKELGKRKGKVYVDSVGYGGEHRELVYAMIDQAKHYKDFYPQFDVLEFDGDISYKYMSKLTDPNKGQWINIGGNLELFGRQR